MTPKTYNPTLLDEIAKRIYVKAIEKAEAIIDGNEPVNSDKLTALAAVADACACGFKQEEKAVADEWQE